MKESTKTGMACDMADTILMSRGLGLPDSLVDGRAGTLAPLVERARGGDSAAFEQLMIFYQQRVISTAWRMLGNREDARDAAQEVFLRVHKYLARVKLDQDFSGWIYRIVINVCRDLARKRGRPGQFTSFEAEIGSGRLEMLTSSDDVEASAIRAQQQALILKALTTLSKKEREAIVLRDLEGLSTQEVALILGSSQATVRSQISSARAKIKQYRDRVVSRSRG
jgi:RNA polymerase sigma-70 factor, ECF subfamily